MTKSLEDELEVNENKDENPKIKRVTFSIKKYGGKIFNPRIGIATGLFMGSLAAYSHEEYGLATAALVGAKHFATSLSFGGIGGRLCQYGAKMKNPALAWTLGQLYPTLFMNGALLTMHYATRTPEPLKAMVIPFAIGVGLINPAVIYLTRKGILKE